MKFNNLDLAEMRKRGISTKEASRQLMLLRNPPHVIVLDHPCTVGDGIRVCSRAEVEKFSSLYEEARAQGRLSAFIPASGASSRMFAAFHSRNHESHEVMKFMRNLRKFAFFEDLRAVHARQGLRVESLIRQRRFEEIIHALLGPQGLNYGQFPKALIPFHRYPSGSRTAFEEHLVLASKLLKDSEGICRLHFTVSPDQERPFRDFASCTVPRYEVLLGCRYEIRFSVQDRSTDTLAVDLKNRPFHLKDGTLLFRPAGHGALIDNLNKGRGDVVFINNIDNVTFEEGQKEIVRWRKVLAGCLIDLQRQPFDRPWRVCGVVKNTGEPGGAPFWVKGLSGELSLQIVEAAQISHDPRQRRIFSFSTHFNPVDMVCGLRDFRGRPFDLRKFADPSAAFVSERSHDGRRLKALEHPGLWNGAMAGWNTVFIEVPLSTFNPVKTVNDLLGSHHQ